MFGAVNRSRRRLRISCGLSGAAGSGVEVSAVAAVLHKEDGLAWLLLDAADDDVDVDEDDDVTSFLWWRDEKKKKLSYTGFMLLEWHLLVIKHTQKSIPLPNK